MKVYILRHGEASFSASSDSMRPLTDFGIMQATKVGEYLTANNIHFDYAFVSPYLRARQTFKALLPFIQVEHEKIENELTPNGNEDYALEAIFSIAAKSESILLVSHLPIVSELTSALTLKNERPMFATAELACVELNDSNPQSKGMLLWMKQIQT